MPSIGHVAIGIAASRFNRKNSRAVWTPFGAAVVWSTISLLPDLDVVGSRFGIRYEDTWGHRGVSHSFAFALVVAVAVYAFGRFAKFRALKMATTAFVVLAVHAVLDTFTDGGHGCALLWPFSDERIFAPWTPIPVAPMGRDFFSMEGLTVAALELLFCLPLLAYALWPARNRRIRATEQDRPSRNEGSEAR
jgi:inner membrane protein